MEITYQLKRFSDLSNHELYNILKLRQKVFIVEQDCPYLDNDGLDEESFHLSGYFNDEIVAYSRLQPSGLVYSKYAAIGRVITASSVRGMGIGRDLMNRSIVMTRMLWPNCGIKISAQTYLKKFYSSLGFKQIGKEYIEDGIPHFHMILFHKV